MAAATVKALIVASMYGMQVTDVEADDVPHLVAIANVDEMHARWAAATVGVSVRKYLEDEGLVPRPAPRYSARLHALADCIIWRESRGNPNAVNPRSGASGLGQFLRSTWAGTPQGKAGDSVFNAAANREAVLWMLSVGRGREFVTIGGC